MNKQEHIFDRWRNEFWKLNGLYHREGGPAIEYANGHKEWHFNGKLHREDGPAIEYEDGNKEWYINGILHRVDGPAVECVSGHKEWYLNGVEYTEKEFKRYQLITKLAGLK